MSKVKSLAFDGLTVLGAAVLCYGLWLAWRPLGFIVGGMVIAAAGVFFGYDRDVIRRRS